MLTVLVLIIEEVGSKHIFFTQGAAKRADVRITCAGWLIFILIFFFLTDMVLQVRSDSRVVQAGRRSR